tara:strand:+ start:587 stop:1195 length:609 start_codon:yes stop_codon:yes gene_type:complete
MNIPVIKKVDYEKTPLCEIAIKYGSDKCPHHYHYYTPKYYEILHDKKVNKMLEIGIGHYEMMKNYVGDNYERGASLKMWREFFKDANIYGCDILEDVIFEDDRIKTYLCNQQRPYELETMMSKIGKCDIILDDGSHENQHQFISFIILWKYVEKDGFYIIEDLLKGFLEHIGQWAELFDDCSIHTVYAHKEDIQGFVCFKKD